MVFTSAILLMGRRHVGDGGASSTVLAGELEAAGTSCSRLELTVESCSGFWGSSAIRSTLKAGGGGGEGDLGFGAGGGGDCGVLGIAPRFLGTGRGVAGVVERMGITRAGSSLDGGGGIIPWPGWGLLATGRDTEMSPASGAGGAADLRLITFGGELTPDTSGDGSSAWTTVAGCSGADGGGGGGDLALAGEDGLDGAGVGPLISTDGIDSKLSFEPAFLNGCGMSEVT